MIGHTIIVGEVTAFDGRYFEIRSPDAPPHLAILYLTPRQVMGACVGDHVRLEYQTTASSGLWNVVEIVVEIWKP